MTLENNVMFYNNSASKNNESNWKGVKGGAIYCKNSTISRYVYIIYILYPYYMYILFVYLEFYDLHTFV